MPSSGRSEMFATPESRSSGPWAKTSRTWSGWVSTTQVWSMTRIDEDVAEAPLRGVEEAHRVKDVAHGLQRCATTGIAGGSADVVMRPILVAAAPRCRAHAAAGRSKLPQCRGRRPERRLRAPARRRAARTSRRTPTEDPFTVAKQRNRKPARRRDKKGGPGSGRRKPCLFCKDQVEQVDYKDVATLRKFISERGKIRSRRITGACRRHQSQVARAVKRARELALLPYVAEARDERGRPRERGGSRPGSRPRER